VVKTLQTSPPVNPRFASEATDGEAHEGNRRDSGGPRYREKSLEVKGKTRRAAAFASGSSRGRRWRIVAESKALKAGVTVADRVGKPELPCRDPRSGRSPGPRGTKALRREKALKENPTSGTSLKNGRTVLEEGNRQEGEKP